MDLHLPQEVHSYRTNAVFLLFKAENMSSHPSKRIHLRMTQATTATIIRLCRDFVACLLRRSFLLHLQ